MRNLFDQYTQPENRLTHALASCLAQEAGLLQRFVRWATGKRAKERLYITEQSLPGEDESSAETDQERGLPDAWIYTAEGWALLIESKIAAAPSSRQLRRHLAVAARRGFDPVSLLLLIPRELEIRPSKRVTARRWDDLYRWVVVEARRSVWARHLANYMEISEAKLSNDGYLTEGGLTVFSGIPFSEEHPYSYLEGKRLLRLAVEGLRQDKRLLRRLGMDPKGEGRPAITGKGRTSVWDFLPMRFSGRKGVFTSAPHLTLSIHDDHLWVHITIPNAVRREFRRRLIEHGEEHFTELLDSVYRGLVKALKGAGGAVPWLQILQRHYVSQRSPGIEDARLEFDLRTAFAARGPVKYQPEWLRATFRAFSRKRSNIQLVVGAEFPYSRCPVVATPRILDYIAATWLACAPLLDAMRGK